MKPGLLPQMLLRERHGVSAWRSPVHPAGKTIAVIGPAGKTIAVIGPAGKTIAVPTVGV